MAFYERLISRGIAEADARGSAIDHVTARRLALWLLPRSQQEPDFMRGLIHFARTGGVTDPLRKALRRQARSPAHPNRPASRLAAAVRRRPRHATPAASATTSAPPATRSTTPTPSWKTSERVQSRRHPEPAAGDWQDGSP